MRVWRLCDYGCSSERKRKAPSARLRNGHTTKWYLYRACCGCKVEDRKGCCDFFWSGCCHNPSSAGSLCEFLSLTGWGTSESSAVPSSALSKALLSGFSVPGKKTDTRPLEDVWEDCSANALGALKVYHKSLLKHRVLKAVYKSCVCFKSISLL